MNVEVVIGCVITVLVLHILGEERWFPVPTVPPKCHHTHHPRCSGVDEQGGEFAFVAFGMAERLGIIEPQLCKLLLTTVAISMAATPALSNFSAWVADQVCLLALRRFTQTAMRLLLDFERLGKQEETNTAEKTRSYLCSAHVWCSAVVKYWDVSTVMIFSLCQK